jgi:D-3-phosphoglycerate dehydrogenase
MKKSESKLRIKRTSTSPYFSAAFNELEKKSLAPFAEFTESAADVLITNTHTIFADLNQDDLQKTKLIIHPNSGYDNFPENFVANFKAPIIIGSPIRGQAVSQYILSALFSHYSEIPAHKNWDKNRKWPRKLISDLKITLVGFGHIGKIIHAALKDMAIELSVYDPFEKFNEFKTQNSDVLIMASGLNSTSRHLINKQVLNTLKPDALIINAARGELIQTAALVDFLKKNSEAFAVLDVFEKEPNDFSDFSDLVNIKLTSHIAGVYAQIDARTIDFEVAILKDFTELSEKDFREKHQKIILQNKLRTNIGLI